jgi:nicotinamidase-related amidase
VHDALPYGPLGPDTRHLCVDMQTMFAERTEWHVPWLQRVLDPVLRLARSYPDRTIFTRFVPPAAPDETNGTWRRYFERWRSFTREQLDPAGIELVPPLRALVPPARVFDKRHYSAFRAPGLEDSLRRDGVQALIVTGSETDVCVLATVLDAVDRGFRVVLATDAICSVSDRTHDALVTLYRERFGQQIEVGTTDTVLRAWQATAGSAGGS